MECNKLSLLVGDFFFFFTVVHAKPINKYYAGLEFSVCVVDVLSDIVPDLKCPCPIKYLFNRLLNVLNISSATI